MAEKWPFLAVFSLFLPVFRPFLAFFGCFWPFFRKSTVPYLTFFEKSLFLGFFGFSEVRRYIGFLEARKCQKVPFFGSPEENGNGFEVPLGPTLNFSGFLGFFGLF